MKLNPKLFATLAVVVCFLALGQRAYSQPTFGSPVVSPEVSPDHKVTLRLLAPNAKDVKVMGDFVTNELAMTKDDKGVWSFTTPTLAPGVYGYYFRVEGVRIPDPGNLLISSGARFLKSYVDVPGEKPEFWAVRDVPHGTLHEHLYKSPSLGTTRRVIVYTPPGYNASAAKTYPVVYLYHGSGDNETYWSRVGRANSIMDNQLAEGKCKPALLVMAYGHSSVPPGAEGGENGVELYEVSVIKKDLLENVIPLIEKEYRVGKSGKDRAILGMTMGGYQAMTIGLNNPSKFGYVAGLSAGFRADQDLESNFKGLLSDPAGANKELKLVWIGIGSTETGGIAINRRVEEFLTSKGIKHEWAVVEGGTHTWVSWRGYFRDLLPRLFTDK